MIPGNIELTDDILSEISKNPVLLRWLSEVQSQLVSSTTELNGVGCTRIVWNETGSDIDALQVVNADNGLTLSYFDAAGTLQKSAVVIEGSWIASSGFLSVGRAREMTRIA